MKIIVFRVLFALLLTVVQNPALAQIDENQLGIWTAYTWSTRFTESNWGLQGDLQRRNWDIYKDLEQHLIRAGVTFSPDSTNATYAIGLASVTSSQFGDGTATNTENRIFQEATFPQRVGQRIYLSHRVRVEQRWIENQDFRTRYRYSLRMEMPLNRLNLDQGAWSLTLFNELFLNGERKIGNNRHVDIFDRNRSYVGVGHRFKDNLKLQFGYMHQWTDNLHKGQLQLGLSHRF
ncbi:MAG: hypothetical protein ACJA2Q_002465 [Pseudohongiellaceae bacterium]|jgi:hypothetical protein